MADDGDLTFGRQQLRDAIARLKEEQQHLDEREAAQSRAVALPDPEQELRKLVAEILAIAAHVPEEPSDAINSRNAGSIIVEAAAEEMRCALDDLLLARRRDDYLRAAYRLAWNIRQITPYTDITPGTVHAAISQENKENQTRLMRAAKKSKPRTPSETDIAFRKAVEQRVSEGTALTDLKPRDLATLLKGMLPRTISYHLQKYKKAHSDN